MLYELNNILPASNGSWVRVLRGSGDLLRSGVHGSCFSSSCIFSGLRVRLWCFHIDCNDAYSRCIICLSADWRTRSCKSCVSVQLCSGGKMLGGVAKPWQKLMLYLTSDNRYLLSQFQKWRYLLIQPLCFVCNLRW